MTSGVSPKVVKSPLAKEENTLFDDCGLLFEAFFAGWKKERELCVRKSFGPRFDVIG